MYTPVTKCHSMWYSLLPSEAYLIQLQFHIIEYLTASDKWVILKNRKNDSLLHRLILLNLPVLILSDLIYLSYLFSSYLNFNLRSLITYFSGNLTICHVRIERAQPNFCIWFRWRVLAECQTPSHLPREIRMPWCCIRVAEFYFKCYNTLLPQSVCSC
jgi:hypothetical protein